MSGQYLTSVVLEFAEEDLSDSMPTWIDVAADCQGIEYWSGIQREDDPPQPGGAVIRMKNPTRRWEPDYAAGQFYPNITTHRRFRLTLDDAAGAAVQEGLWYVTDIAIDYPADTGYSVVTFTCSDGSEVLALDDLPQLDPPDAVSVSDVVAFDEPLAHFILDDPPGTKAAANFRFRKRTVWRSGDKTRRKFRSRRGTRYETKSEASATVGSTGTYKGLPVLGVDGLILGESLTAVQFTNVTNQAMRAPIDERTFVDPNAFTLECWIKPLSVSGTSTLMAGPFDTATAASPIRLRLDVGGTPDVYNLSVAGATISLASTTTPTVDVTVHLAATFDGTTARLYVNGVEEDSVTTSGEIVEADPDDFLYIGSNMHGAGSGDFVIQHAAFYEHALTPERVAAHYTAGSARGWPEQTAGARIADIATHALWSEASIQTTGRDVLPQMKHGQPRLEEIAELAHAEGPRTMFFFNGTGDPIYLGHEWQAGSSSYNTTQATLGDQPGETNYEAIELVYDNEVYNEVTVSHEAGEAATVGTGTPPPRRANTEFTDVLLMKHIHVESLANAVLAFYEDPQQRPVSVTLNGADPGRLNHILRRDIGHQVRVKKSGVSGARIDRITNIIGKRKVLTVDKHLTCTWTLGRGFNAGDPVWHAGVVGFTEAGQTTEAA